MCEKTLEYTLGVWEAAANRLRYISEIKKIIKSQGVKIFKKKAIAGSLKYCKETAVAEKLKWMLYSVNRLLIIFEM